MDNRELKKQLIEAAVRIDRRNMQTNNGGNFSARCGEQMLVKPTEVSFVTAVADELVYADFNGRAVNPGPKPSKESVLHGLIYSNFEEVGAIMHCHSPWAITWAESMQPLDYATYHAGLKLGNTVPVFDTNSYAVSFEEGQRIISELKKQNVIKAFLLRGHGLVAMGRNISDAVNTAELIEETAMIAILVQLCGFRKKTY